MGSLALASSTSSSPCPCSCFAATAAHCPDREMGSPQGRHRRTCSPTVPACPPTASSSLSASRAPCLHSASS
eukprot:7517408-Alexandrium_andersonii.AAC.1